MKEWLFAAAGFWAIVAMITHVVVCVSTNWTALLLVGLFVPPVGIIHGTGVMLGAW